MFFAAMAAAIITNPIFLAVCAPSILLLYTSRRPTAQLAVIAIVLSLIAGLAQRMTSTISVEFDRSAHLDRGFDVLDFYENHAFDTNIKWWLSAPNEQAALAALADVQRQQDNCLIILDSNPLFWISGSWNPQAGKMESVVHSSLDGGTLPWWEACYQQSFWSGAALFIFLSGLTIGIRWIRQDKHK